MTTLNSATVAGSNQIIPGKLVKASLSSAQERSMCRGLHCEALRGSGAHALLQYPKQNGQMEVQSLHPSPAFPLACPMSPGAAGGAKWVMEDCRTNILHWEMNSRQHKVWVHPQGLWAMISALLFPYQNEYLQIHP